MGWKLFFSSLPPVRRETPIQRLILYKIRETLEGGEICTSLEKVESKHEKFSSKWFSFFYRIFSYAFDREPMHNSGVGNRDSDSMVRNFPQNLISRDRHTCKSEQYLLESIQVQSNHSFSPITNISVDNLIFLDHFIKSYCSPPEKTEVVDSCSSYRIFIKGPVKPNERKTIIVIHDHVSIPRTTLSGVFQHGIHETSIFFQAFVHSYEQGRDGSRFDAEQSWPIRIRNAIFILIGTIYDKQVGVKNHPSRYSHS